MSLTVRIASDFDRDVALQIQWHLRHANAQVAGDYADAVDATLEFPGRFPELGPHCRFSHPELRELRQFRVGGFFDRHQIFYRSIRPGGIVRDCRRTGVTKIMRVLPFSP